MFGSLIKLWRNRKGSPSVEFAILSPIVIVVAAGLIELGSYINDTVTLEKSVRSGAMMAARSPAFNAAPGGADATDIQNVVMRGSTNASAPFLLQGWNNGSAIVTVTLRQVTLNSGGTIDVIRVNATLPYVEVITGFFSFMGGLTIGAQHEQIRIGS